MAFDRARKEEMARMGVTEDMLQMARDSGAALERAIEGLKVTRSSYETQRSFARNVEENANQVYNRAKMAVAASQDDEAKRFLLEHRRLKDKLKKALVACVEEKQRLEVMERNVDTLEQRAREVESLLNQAVGAKARSDSRLALSEEDPLLRAFRDLGMN